MDTVFDIICGVLFLVEMFIIGVAAICEKKVR